jgi:hypothetical protein
MCFHNRSTMEWFFWLTVLMLILTLFLFLGLMYNEVDPKTPFPPLWSEVIERNKNIMVIMFGFVTGLLWMNLMMVGLLMSDYPMIRWSILLYFTSLGIFAFDISKYRVMHYLFVLLMMATALIMANTIDFHIDGWYKNILNVGSVIFIANVITTWVVLTQNRNNMLNKYHAVGDVQYETIEAAPSMFGMRVSGKWSRKDNNNTRYRPADAAESGTQSPGGTHIKLNTEHFDNPLRAIYTLCETLWIISFFVFVIAVSYEFKDDYSTLLIHGNNTINM